MKKIYYFMLAMTACLLSSCFDDDGNYTYTEVPEISISDWVKHMYSTPIAEKCLKLTLSLSPIIQT